MRLSRIVGALAGSLVSVALFGGSGCSSKTSGNGTTPPAGDSGTVKMGDSGTTGHDGSMAQDSGSSSGDTGGGDTGGDSGDAGSCSPPASVASFTPATYVPAVAHQGVCSTTQVTAFISACGFSQSATPQTCTTWQTANVGADGGNACGNCILAPMNNGGLWLDPEGMNNAYVGEPNYAGCIQLTDPTHGSACAAAFNNVNACDGVACDMSCAMEPQDFGNCAATVNAAGCSKYNTAEMSACSSDFDDAGNPTASTAVCFPSVTSGNGDDDLTYIVNLICGSGATDGGSPTDGSTPSDGGAEQ